MKVAVTGATGFLGKYLCKRLEKEKINYDTFDKDKHNLFNRSSLRRLISDKDIVIHLAGCNRIEDISELMRVNILGTKGVLDVMAKYSQNARLIFASSSQVYLKKSIYGESKKKAEEIIKQYVKNHLIKNACILRFTNLYGVGGKPFYNSVVATFIHLIKNGKEIIIDGDGKQTIDFLYVEDAVGAIIKAAESDLKDGVEIFDICSGKQTSINEVMRILSKSSSKKIRLQYNNLPKEQKRLIKSYKKAKNFLGWKPKTSLEDGLKLAMR